MAVLNCIFLDPIFVKFINKLLVIFDIFPTFVSILHSFEFENYNDVCSNCQCWSVYSQSVSVQTRKTVTAVSVTNSGKFLLEVGQQPTDHAECVEADYLLIASGSSRQVVVDNWFIWVEIHEPCQVFLIKFFLSQGYTLASQLGHSIVDPVPSLFTFKIEDLHLRELSGVKY